MSFFPSNFNSESLGSGGGGGNYFKPGEGKSKVRICSDAIFGWVYWSVDNKPVRSADHPGNNPPGIRLDDAGKPERVKPFLAMAVWDYANQKVCVWEITQATIMRALEDLVEDDDWGDPKGFDLTINRTGKGLETSYSLIPSNMKPLGADILTALDATPVNLAALYAGENPFDPNSVATLPSAEDGAAWKQFEDLLDRADGDQEKLRKAEEWAINKMPMRAEEVRAKVAALSIPF